MKIQHIRIKNFVGVRDIDLAFDTPVALFAGLNGAGKSSLQEAIRAALTGDVERVTTKKTRGALIADGEKRASVTLGTDHGEASLVITPSDTKWEGLAINMDALPYVLDASTFSRSDAATRRTFLFNLTGLSGTADGVRKQLLDAGADEKLIEGVVPLLRSGFPAACDYAKERAKESKTSWRTVTGETYGEKKAEGWEADAPLFDARKLDATKKDLAGCDERIGERNKELGVAEQKAAAYSKWQAQSSGGAEAAAHVVRCRAKLETDEQHLAKAESALMDATQRAGAAPRVGLVHELAAGLLTFIALSNNTDGVSGLGAEGDVTEWNDIEGVGQADEAYLAYVKQYGQPGAAGDNQAREQLPELTSARDLMQRAVANSRRDLASAEAAVAALELQGDVEKITQEDVDAIKKSLEAARRQRAELQTTVDALAQDKVKSEAAQQKTTDAAKHHSDVAAWLLIAEQLAPDGIPGKMLEQALKPINAHLSAYSKSSGFLPVTIEKDMAITSDDRPYALLSESEKWRVDAMIAVAIAHLSKLGMVMLDRVDVLDLESRGDLLEWLDELAEFNDIECAILCGTLKAVPAVLNEPDRSQWLQISGYWIEEGVIVHADAVATA
ncbi:AAA family ATPase [Robbsia andropogonis]|uniref:AAA family ATPase n=1 Tax=Robbsia andropogonis TaxID=28092 RepID=UPI003D1D3F23